MSKNISVILACLNYEPSCQLSIDSIIKSNSINNLFQELIIIIGSKSDRKKILKNYKGLKNKGLTIKVEISRNGIYAAYNHGLKIATGEYLLFIGDGEEINCEIYFLKRLEKYLKLNLDTYIFNLSFNNKSSFRKLKIKDLKCPPHQTILYSNRIIKENKICYDEKLRIYADAFFTRSYLDLAENFIFTSIALVDFKEGGLGNSIDGTKYRIVDQLRIFYYYRRNIKGLLLLIRYLIIESFYLLKKVFRKYMDKSTKSLKKNNS